MAIDNDTSYELTGAQVKDLAQKIRHKADNNVFVGASSSVAGSKGIVPAPAIGDNIKFLKGDGDWSQVTTSTIQGGAVTAAKIDWTTIPHQFLVTDNADMKLTCSKAGTYLVFAQMSWNGAGTMVAELRKNNNTNLAQGVDSRGAGGDWGNISVKAIASLAVGDVIAFYNEPAGTIIKAGNYARNNIGMIYIGP